MLNITDICWSIEDSVKSDHFVLLSVQLENSLVSSWRILSSVHEKFDVWIKLPKLIIRVDPNRY